jgi:hypothetical protein
MKVWSVFIFCLLGLGAVSYYLTSEQLLGGDEESSSHLCSSFPAEGEHVELIRGCFFNPATDYGPDFEKNLALIAPEDIREMAQDHYSMSPKWVSLALFSDLEKQLPNHCSRYPVDEICDPARLAEAQSRIDFLLADMIRNAHELSLLRAVRYTCANGQRAMGIANQLKNAEPRRALVARQMLIGCGLPPSHAIRFFMDQLKPDGEMIAIAALELHRLGAVGHIDKLEDLKDRLPAGLDRAIISYVISDGG